MCILEKNNESLKMSSAGLFSCFYSSDIAEVLY